MDLLQRGDRVRIELRDQRGFIFEDVLEDRDRALAERFGLSIVAAHLVQGGEVVQDIRDIGMVAPVDRLEALQGAPVQRFRGAAVFPLRVKGVRQVIQQATEFLVMGARRYFEERDRIPETAFGACIFALCLGRQPPRCGSRWRQRNALPPASLGHRSRVYRVPGLQLQRPAGPSPARPYGLEIGGPAGGGR